MDKVKSCAWRWPQLAVHMRSLRGCRERGRMKVTKSQLKELIREQVKAVIEAHDDYHDDEWFDVEGERPPVTDQTSAGNITSDEEFKVDLESLVDQVINSAENPEDIMATFLDKHLPSRSEEEVPEEEEEEFVDLRGMTPTRQSIARLKHRIKQHTGEEPVDLGHVDPRTGRVRVKESHLKDLIKEATEEDVRELRAILPTDIPYEWEGMLLQLLDLLDDRKEVFRFAQEISDGWKRQDVTVPARRLAEKLKKIIEEQTLSEKKKKKNWMGDLDPEHKGYCTPMTKKTCTPKRKALAKRFKKAARKKKKEGGTGWQGKV